MFNEGRARAAARYKTGRQLVTAVSTPGCGSCVCSACNTSLHLVATIKKAAFVCLQPESEEKSVVYDNIGPNVCMGDHKVKMSSLLESLSSISGAARCDQYLRRTVQLSCNPVFFVPSC